MSEKLCPECGHPTNAHTLYNGSCATSVNTIFVPPSPSLAGCPCTRTCESLVGEKGKTRLTMKPADSSMPIPVEEKGSKTAKELGIECECVNWSVREYKEWEAARYGQHRPNCDGKGNHVPLPPESAKCAMVDGVPIGPLDAKPEPSLSLLVIDLGYCCAIKVEKGLNRVAELQLGSIDTTSLYGFGATISRSTFTDLRSAIDGEKPVPRIERRGKSYLFYPYNRDTHCISFTLSKTDYDALSTLAGKPLPIYEGRVWEELTVALHKKEGVGWVWIDERDLTVWRYTR